MLNRSASLAMSTSVLKALPGKLDIKRHSPGILYISFLLLEKELNWLSVCNMHMFSHLEISSIVTEATDIYVISFLYTLHFCTNLLACCYIQPDMINYSIIYIRKHDASI